MCKRSKDNGDGDGGFINLIISPPPPFFLFPSYVLIWFSIVHRYLCQSQIWFYYIMLMCLFMSMLLGQETYFWKIIEYKIITLLHG